MAETQPAPEPKKSDLGTRALSAVVMVAVAGTALWLGGWALALLVAGVGLGALWEWRGLVWQAFSGSSARVVWLLAGFLYVGLACAFPLSIIRDDFAAAAQMAAGYTIPFGSTGRAGVLLPFFAAVIATDVGAYFTGRTLGGPKLAPKISPGKTWSGLVGGVVAAGLAYAATLWHFDNDWSNEWWWHFALFGAIMGMIAQAGDLFESWLKRRAGAKDSGRLIPGHGGLLDRVDGLLAVFLLPGVLEFIHLVGLK